MKAFVAATFCLLFSLSVFPTTPTNQELFEGKNITVLGGTGYLGRWIATEVLQYNPKSVTIYSRDEVKHFNVSNILGNDPRIRYVIGDIRDYAMVLKATEHANIVFHVAALKRMDMIESNVEEAVKTNIVGSLNVFNACVANGVDKVLFISTDKACLPINTYGACKFVSEKVFTNYDKTKIKTKFLATRFGNILESTGSVIPIFINKIKRGEDIPLTHERMTRFIITKQEAAKLIFDALRYGTGGEIFIKKLPAMKIIDLIEVLKDLFKADNKVHIIGLRPGEKFDEVLVNESELCRTYLFNDCLVIRPSVASLYDNATPEKPIYMTQGQLAEGILKGHYSSDQAVVSKENLGALLQQLGLL